MLQALPGGAWIHGVVRHLRERESAVRNCINGGCKQSLHVNSHLYHGRPQAGIGHFSVDIISAQDVDMHQSPA